MRHTGDSLALLQDSKKNLASPLRTEDRSILFQDGCKGFTVVGHRDFLLPVIFAVKVINSPFHLALEVQGAHGLLLDCINFTYPGVTVEGLHHDDLYVSWGLDKCVTNTTSKNQTPTGIQKEDFTVVLKGTGRSLTVNINGRANLTYPRNFDDDVRNIRLVASPNLRVRLPVPSLEQGCVVGSYFMCKTKNKYAHLTMQNYDKVYIRKIYANEYFSISDPCTKEDKEAVLQPSYFERSDWVPAQVQVRKTSIQYLINLIIGGEVRGEYQSFYRTYDLDCGKKRMKGIRVSFKADFSLNCNPEPQLEEEEHDPYRSYYITRLQTGIFKIVE
ncbi:hypothetical protein Hamer_G018657 [Homarus americanus]|uniref:Uncharacterized protein n=1 Tax=Homarus americanus TaxID=6706 RepID=A0A8J5N4W0_HOMAM|nr:hypothetical protein Hamer_G018657 [Homarus americanus]